MGSKVEQQYKLLNAELMDQVQKQRIEIGLYKKELIALKHENMDLREERALQIARQRQDHIDIVKGLMRRLDIDERCLADSSQTTELEPKSSEASFVLNRRSQQRRSSREICQEMRQSSALASSQATISPTKRRDTIVEHPKEAPGLTHTPPPLRVAEIALDSSSEEEEEQTNTSVAQEEQAPIEEQAQRDSGSDLCTIVEYTDEETSQYSSYTASPISCDSTIEEFVPRQVLRSLDPNVSVAGGGMQTRAKCKSAKSIVLDRDNSIEEQPSIQVPRLQVTQPSPTLVDSLMNCPSFALDASKLSPRRSIFEGNLRMGGSNTSTPIPKRSSTQQKTAVKETSKGCTRTSGNQPKVRLRKLIPEPREAEQTTDMSTSCLSSSGRPSRRCRPTQLSEPNLKEKMRNSSVGKKTTSK
ncbi:hypothetical protein KR054_006305 [Drosophila jambulina]|nr:hypothetical protein KR054_006305 [Drosophila jambulina]